MRLASIAAILSSFAYPAYAQDIPKMEISQFINNVRDQLIKTSSSAGFNVLPLEVKDIEIRIEYLIEVTAEGSASFWVVSTGAGAKGAGTNVTTIRLGLPDEQKYVSYPGGNYGPVISSLQTASEYADFIKLYGGVSAIERLPDLEGGNSTFDGWKSLVLAGGGSYEEFKKKINENPQYLEEVLERYKQASREDPENSLWQVLKPEINDLSTKIQAADRLEQTWKEWVAETAGNDGIVLGDFGALSPSAYSVATPEAGWGGMTQAPPNSNVPSQLFGPQ